MFKIASNTLRKRSNAIRELFDRGFFINSIDKNSHKDCFLNKKVSYYENPKFCDPTKFCDVYCRFSV